MSHLSVLVCVISCSASPTKHSKGNLHIGGFAIFWPLKEIVFIKQLVHCLAHNWWASYYHEVANATIIILDLCHLTIFLYLPLRKSWNGLPGLTVDDDHLSLLGSSIFLFLDKKWDKPGQASQIVLLLVPWSHCTEYEYSPWVNSSFTQQFWCYTIKTAYILRFEAMWKYLIINCCLFNQTALAS